MIASVVLFFNLLALGAFALPQFQGAFNQTQRSTLKPLASSRDRQQVALGSQVGLGSPIGSRIGDVGTQNSKEVVGVDASQTTCDKQGKPVSILGNPVSRFQARYCSCVNDKGFCTRPYATCEEFCTKWAS